MTMASINKETHQQPTQKLSQIDNIEEELMLSDNDFLMSYSDRICSECGIDHSFRPNFEGVKTSIDIIPQLLQRKNNNNRVKIQEAAK
jgi:hypothetical protein